jgi:hypothetical protein
VSQSWKDLGEKSIFFLLEMLDPDPYTDSMNANPQHWLKGTGSNQKYPVSVENELDVFQ